VIGSGHKGARYARAKMTTEEQAEAHALATLACPRRSGLPRDAAVYPAPQGSTTHRAHGPSPNPFDRWAPNRKTQDRP